MQRLILVRHGETKWSLSGQHTGRTDIPLTENGVKQALQLKEQLKHFSFEKAFVSPLLRAKDTFILSALQVPSEFDENLYEWDYGDYEGLTSQTIREKNPSWNIFSKGAPGGESIEAVQKRADLMIVKAKHYSGDVVFFSSGHILRAIASRWLGFPLSFGKHIPLSTASISILGYEHENPALLLWNKENDFTS